jgi:Protein of unknown function (DUF3363)
MERQHLGRIREQFEREGRDGESFVRSHVRRLEALRRAGHVERIDEDHWKIPKDIVERGQNYDRAKVGDGPTIKVISSETLERQIGADAATWLDRELTSRVPQVVADSGFDHDVRNVLERAPSTSLRWAMRPSEMATCHTVASLEQREVDRVGRNGCRTGFDLHAEQSGRIRQRPAHRRRFPWQWPLRHDGRWIELPTSPLATRSRKPHRPIHQAYSARVGTLNGNSEGNVGLACNSRPANWPWTIEPAA